MRRRLTMKASSRRRYLAAMALLLATCVSTAHSEELLRIPRGFALAKKVPGTTSGKFTAIIGNPEIADFTYGPNNTFMFIGKKDGTTNVVVLDNSNGREIYNATIAVGSTDDVNITVYVGMNDGRGYTCSKSSCAAQK